MTRDNGAHPQELIKQRREEFMRRIAGGVAVFPSAPTAIRNGDVEHEYRQDSDLYYLTGFEEPGSLAVLVPDHPEHRFVMFVQPREREREVWTGWRAGEEGAKSSYGADAAFTIDKLDEELPKLVEKANRIYYRFGSDPRCDDRVVGLMRRFQRERQRKGFGPASVIDPAELLHELRLIKTGADLELLRRAVNISCEAHLEAMRAVRPGMFEYEIEAVLRYVWRKNGSPRPGYAPIVASGANATVLHYTSNKRRIEDGDLVLIDAGTEFGYYTGDVTRTFPANGKFTETQREIYRLVLDAQTEALRLVRPGAQVSEPHDRVVRVLTEGLIRLGLLDGEVDKLIEENDYKKFYMHGTSHWLGMDVHDAGPYKVADEWRKLEPGMVLTIEPGIYIAEDLEGVDSRYRGIGVRIEDDVLVTEDGAEVLSGSVPRTIADIEGLMSEARRALSKETEE
ncbi:MAG TPA: aminopeptidase P N-terminal domain-containing protein [Blastocatellia bacterium]|nr:aminopeptidase P N-terminal domain-containing protein [Blastocatellia bacterium]